MLNSREILWVTVIYNIIILFSKRAKDKMIIKLPNKNPNKTDLWSFTKEDIKDALREDTGEINCELRP
jgi:hypothetical protein